MLYPRPGRPGSASRRPVSAVAPIPFFSFHHVNAYEEDEAAGGAVVIDTIAWRQFDFDKTLHTITLDHFNGGQRTEYCRLQVGQYSMGSYSMCDRRALLVWMCRLIDAQVSPPKGLLAGRPRPSDSDHLFSPLTPVPTPPLPPSLLVGRPC